MLALKACWSVQGGLVPGEPMPQYSRQWLYDSQHYADDGNARGRQFHDMCDEAHAYAKQLESGGLNWVTVSYVWV